jgi:hypothetical protein
MRFTYILDDLGIPILGVSDFESIYPNAPIVTFFQYKFSPEQTAY